MSGDYSGGSHPARKVDREELKRVLAWKNEDLPAVTKSAIAPSFSNVEPQTVKDNLDALAENEEICRCNDGSVVLYWYPREGDEAGEVQLEDVLDDSIDYSDVDPEDVPLELAEEIASERIPFYRPRSLYSNVISICQLALVSAFGLVVLGIGGLVSDSVGLSQQTATAIFVTGFGLAVLTTLVYAVSMVFEVLAQWGYIAKDPRPWLRKHLQFQDV